jgi:hypothetical protein
VQSNRYKQPSGPSGPPELDQIFVGALNENLSIKVADGVEAIFSKGTRVWGSFFGHRYRYYVQGKHEVQDHTKISTINELGDIERDIRESFIFLRNVKDALYRGAIDSIEYSLFLRDLNLLDPMQKLVKKYNLKHCSTEIREPMPPSYFPRANHNFEIFWN